MTHFSYSSMNFQCWLSSLWHFKEDPAFGSTCSKSNLTYQENYHCVGKCRLSAELLNLKGGKEKYGIIMFKVSPEVNQLTQGILDQRLSYSIDPRNPARRGTLNNLWQNTFWSRFPWSLPPARSFLSKRSHSDHKISKLSYTSAVIPF